MARDLPLAPRRWFPAWCFPGKWFRRVTGVWLGLIVATASGAPAPLPPTTLPDILILNSYAPAYEWSDDMLASVLAVLKVRDRDVEPVIQYLDFKRFTDPAREAWLVEDVADKCRQRPPALIITLDNAAFDFALKYRARLGADVPLVFGGLNRFVPEMIAGRRNITGVSEESDFSGTFQLIRALKPDTRHVLVVCTKSTSSLETRKVFEGYAPRYAERYRLEFEYFDDWTNDELFARMETLPDGWVVLILETATDAAGRNNYNSSAFTEALATRPRVPVFINSRPPGHRDFSVEPWDCIGGGLVSADVHGAKVGELALRVALGERADAIPVVRVSPQQLEVEYRQLQRFGLSLDLLPPGTHVINAPASFYQIDRSRLLLAGAALLVLAAIIAALLLNILWRLRAERALRRAEEQMRGSQKLEAIGLLAGGVAHDFNNLLQVIRGHAGFLKESLAHAPEPLEDVAAIQGATERAVQLTGQLLAFSRKQALKSGAVEINGLVNDMAAMLRRLLGEHIQLQVAPLPEPCVLQADKGQLEQVLLNLCVNARDAMPGGGRILVELRRTEVGAADLRERPELRAGSYLELTVSDTGCGMPPEIQRRIFEPFFTTKAPGKGTGLGLSVVYGVVHQHGGAVRVYSEVGKGTVFRILLPYVAAGSLGPSPETPDALPPGHGVILLAEDDMQVRNIGERVLRKNGFEVLLAADGAEALELIGRHHATIRLAVLDVLMPKRNGRQVFDHLRAHHPRIPVLFCSGYSAEMLPPEIAPEAGLALINKPYAARELLEHVHRLLRR